MAIERFQGEHRFLSNFWPCTVRAWDIDFPSAEHAFQACKSRHSADYARIAALPTPADAKGAGRRLELRSDWDQVRKQVMLRVLLAKFIQNPELAARLAATEDARLVEGNTWHDNYWGSCLCGPCALSSGNSGLADLHWTDRGHNYLGRLLMAVRDVVTVD